MMRALQSGEKLTYCKRCGDPAIGSVSTSPSARPFKKAVNGLCTPCVVCSFFQGDVNNGIGFALPDDFDPRGLLLPHVQMQFASVLAVGCSELKMEAIDWGCVVEKWDLGGGVIQ